AAAMELLHFVAPGWLLAFFLGWSEWRDGRGPSATRFHRLGGFLPPFLLGVAAPVVMCLLPFVREGGLQAVYEDIFVLPQLRFAFAAMPLPGLVTVLAALPYAAILAWRS